MLNDSAVYMVNAQWTDVHDAWCPLWQMYFGEQQQIH